MESPLNLRKANSNYFKDNNVNSIYLHNSFLTSSCTTKASGNVVIKGCRTNYSPFFHFFNGSNSLVNFAFFPKCIHKNYEMKFKRFYVNYNNIMQHGIRMKTFSDLPL